MLKIRRQRTVVLGCAAASRVTTLALMVVANRLLPTHDATGVHLYRQDIYRVPGDPGVGGWLAPFTRWDSAWFLSIADCGYPVPAVRKYDLSTNIVDCAQTERGWGGRDCRGEEMGGNRQRQDVHCRDDISLEEQAHAFFPLYPWTIRAVGDVLSTAATGLGRAESMILGGLLVSNSCFIIAVMLLYRLGEVVTGNSLLAFGGSLAFCASPASVFFSTAYSESLFAMLTFAGLVALFSDSRSGRQKGTIKGNRERRGRSGTMQAWIAATLLAAATLTRSNGIAGVGVLVLEKFRWMAEEAGVFAVDARPDTKAIITTDSTAREKQHHVNFRDGWHRWETMPWSRLTACAVMTVLQAILVTAPYVLVQVYGYRKFCGGEGIDANTLEVVTTVMEQERLRPWCAWRVPSIYSYIQSTYWGVGIFSYYQWKQIPNFLLAAPVLALTAWGIARFLLAQFEDCDGISAMLKPVKVADDERKGVNLRKVCCEWLERTAVMFFGPPRLPHPGSKPFERSGAAAMVLQWGLLGTFALVSMNVQVTTRFLAASCPPLHWWTASLFLFPTRTRNATTASILQRALCLYIVSFFVVGTVLHANFLPWT